VLAKEIEKVGIPTVQICTMLDVAKSVGAPRIVPAKSVLHPLGDTAADTEKEKQLRRDLVREAFAAVSTPRSTLGRRRAG